MKGKTEYTKTIEMKLLGMKNTISEMKTVLNGIKNKSDNVEEKSSELKT